MNSNGFYLFCCLFFFLICLDWQGHRCQQSSRNWPKMTFLYLSALTVSVSAYLTIGGITSEEDPLMDSFYICIPSCRGHNKTWEEPRLIILLFPVALRWNVASLLSLVLRLANLANTGNETREPSVQNKLEPHCQFPFRHRWPCIFCHFIPFLTVYLLSAVYAFC